MIRLLTWLNKSLVQMISIVNLPSSSLKEERRNPNKKLL